MIFHESNGDLVLELFYNLLTITMEKFFELMTSDLTSPRMSRSTTNTDEIRSPISYVDTSRSRIFYQRKTLQSNAPIQLVADELILCDSEKREDQPLSPMYFINRGLKRCLFPDETEDSVTNSAHEETQSNFSFNKSLEDFKMCLMYEKSVHSSPKPLNSHFEDSGFLNCSMEMDSRLETILKTEIRSQKQENNSFPTVDSYLDHHDGKSQPKPDSNLAPNCQLIDNNSGSDRNFDGHSTGFFCTLQESSNA